MRQLPKKRSEKQNLIISATFDYYGSGLPIKQIPLVRNIALYLMGRKRGVVLSDEQKSELEEIRENLKDKIYCQSLLTDPPKTP